MIIYIQKIQDINWDQRIKISSEIEITLSSETEDQIILQSDCAKGTAGHTQPTVVVSDPNLLFPRKKYKVSIDSCQR